jgi:hypothetical protein
MDISALLFKTYLLLVWVLWAFAATWEKRARGDRGSMSWFPIIPIFPWLAYMLTIGLDYLMPHLGMWLVSGVHLIFAFTLIVSLLKSLRLIYSGRGASQKY